MTLLVLLVDNVGTLLVPTMLANMVNTGIATGDVDYISVSYTHLRAHET